MGRNDATSPGDDRALAGSAGAAGAPSPEAEPELPLGGGIPPGKAPDAAGMLQTAVDLLSPAEAAKQLPWLAGELAKIAMGQSELEYGPKDARFKDPTWTANPAFRGLGLSYRLFEE